MYKNVFVQTFIKAALPVLIAAGAWDWSGDHAIDAGSVLGWTLFGCLVMAVFAVAWAFIGSPAVTLLGKALRHAVEALVALPIAAALADVRSWGDLTDLEPLLVPTLIAVVIAFITSYLSNAAPTPTVVPAEARSVGADFVGSKRMAA